MALKDRQKMINALDKLAGSGRALLSGNMDKEYQVFKTEVLTVSRMIFGQESPEYKDLYIGCWRYEEYIQIGCIKADSDLVHAVEDVIAILEGQKKALGYDIEF